MAEKLGEAVLELRTDDSKLDAGIARAEGKAERIAGKFDAAGKRMQNVGAKLSLGLTVPLLAFGTSAAKAAIDAEELESMFDVTFGKMAGAARKWAEKTGDAMGRSTQEIMGMAASFQDILKKQMDPAAAAALSGQLTMLTQDLASFKNLSNEVAQQKIFSGLIGEAEPLRAVGVLLSENAVKAKAMAMGLGGVKGALTEGEKVQARAALIMEQLADAQGDVISTSNSTANKTKSLTDNLYDLQVTVGQKLLPVITPLIARLTDLVNWFTSLPDGVQTFVIALAGVGTVLGPALMGLGVLASTAAKLLPLMTGLAAPTAAAGGAAAGAAGGMAALLRVIGPLGIAAGIAYVAWKNWDTIGPALTNWAPGFVERLGTLQGKLNEFNNRANEVDQRLGIPAKDVFLNSIREDMKATSFDQKKWAAETWAAVQKLDRDIATSARNIWQSFETNWDKATAATARMVDRVNAWFAKIDVSGLKAKVAAAKGYFADLYDKVVGNSYVPDMVDGIAAQMARLDAVMVAPVKDATDRAAAAFRDLQQKTAELLDRLFPEARAANQFAADTATLEAAARAGQLSIDQMRAALERLYGTLPKIEETATAVEGTAGAADTAAAASERLAEKSPFQQWAETIPRTAAQVSTALQGIAVRGFDGLANAITDVIMGTRSLKDAFGSLAKAIISDIIQMTVRMLIFRAISGLIGDGTAPGNDIVVTGPKFKGWFASGGLIPAGSFGIVGERGPEPVIGTSRGAMVLPNSTLRGGGAGGGAPAVVEVRVAAGELFEPVVTRISGDVAVRTVRASAPAIVGAAVKGTLRAATRPRLTGGR